MRRLLPALGLYAVAAHANVVGTDLQNFNGTTSGIDYITVQSSETLEPGYLNFGLVTNYAVNTLPLYQDENATQNRFSANDSLLTGEFLLGAGLMPDLEAGIAIGRLFRQKVDSEDVAHGQFSEPGWTHMRAGGKYRLLKATGYGISTAASATFNNIRNNPYLGTGNSPIYHVELIADTMMADVHLAANIGYRWRKPGDRLPGSGISPTRDQLIGSVAASYLLPIADTKVIGEVFGSRPAGTDEGSNSSRQAASLETLLGLKHDYSSALALVAGGGSELMHGVSSPDWRIFAGVHWAVGPVFSQQEAVIRAQPPAFSPPPSPATPAQPTPPPPEREVTFNVRFQFRSSEVDPASKAIIANLAEIIRKEGQLSKVVVEGHTDSVGSASYNLTLSQQRANAVRDVLIQDHGFTPELIEAIGYGASRPIADNGNFQGREANRRVAVRLIK